MAERGLAEVIDALRRRWRLTALVALPIFLGVTAYAESLPPEYDGSVVVSFAPRGGATGCFTPVGHKRCVDVPGDTLRIYLPQYVSRVKSRVAKDRVADELHVSRTSVEQTVNAAIPVDTTNLTIDVRLRSAAEAARVANALADEIVSATDDDPIVYARVVSPAVAPKTPAAPPRRFYELAGLMAGVLVGATWAFVLERGRPRVRTAQDVALASGFPVVGRVPVSRALKTNPVEALADPAVGAAVRTLRTQIERDSRAKPIHVLVMTSPSPGDGKSTVAAAYATAIARLDARVLLIDGDLRRPRVAEAFGLEVRKGLGQLLRGEATLDECLQSSGIDGLTILPTAVDVEAGDLLARRFTSVLAVARERFDVVIVDAPPILGGDDARTLATLAEAVLFVVRAGTPQPTLAEAASALESLRVRVLGCVLNRYRDRRGVYGAYGAYGTEPTR